MLIAVISLLCSSCGYRIDEGSVPPQLSTLSVPYFSGDQEGILTETVVRALNISGNFEYTDREGSVILEGEVIRDHLEHIGYQYDRRPVSGKRINRLIPNEGRREITVRVSLVDSHSQEVLYGPFDVSASSDYDFVDSDSLRDTSFIDSAGERQSVLFFSLGQLDSAEGAQEATLEPLYERLALKIVEGLSHLPSNFSEPSSKAP